MAAGGQQNPCCDDRLNPPNMLPRRMPDSLLALGAKPSMSRTGCCYDNAPMESFFHSLKVELVHQHRWTTREEARRDLFGYIEGYYNRQRIHSALGYLTPEQAERKAG